MSTAVTFPTFKTLQEAADLVGVSTKTLRREIDRGRLPIYRVNRQIRISDEDLMNYLNDCRE